VYVEYNAVGDGDSRVDVPVTV
jgi:hypothetical protein